MKYRQWHVSSCDPAAVAAMRCGLAARKVRMNLPGGPLDIEWRADNHIFMTGEAVTVFEGDWPD